MTVPCEMDECCSEATQAVTWRVRAGGEWMPVGVNLCEPHAEVMAGELREDAAEGVEVSALADRPEPAP